MIEELPYGECSNWPSHKPHRWPFDPLGTQECPFDEPIATPLFTDGSTLPAVPNVYWDHGEEVVTSYGDFERVAQEYDRDNGTPGDPRAYTEEENVRADAIAVFKDVKQKRADFDRAIAMQAPDELAALQEALLAEEGIEEGDPWRQPTGAHDAYPLGAIVSHEDQVWESTIAANVWEPGVSGWRISGPGIPQWVQPTGGHDAYAFGDIVTHNELYWQSDVEANVWEPGVYGWTEIAKP